MVVKHGNEFGLHLIIEAVLSGELLGKTLSSVALVDDDSLSSDVLAKVHVNVKQGFVFTVALHGARFTGFLEVSLLVGLVRVRVFILLLAAFHVLLHFLLLSRFN